VVIFPLLNLFTLPEASATMAIISNHCWIVLEKKRKKKASGDASFFVFYNLSLIAHVIVGGFILNMGVMLHRLI